MTPLTRATLSTRYVARGLYRIGEQSNSKPGCYLEPEACPANNRNYNRVVVDEDNSYSISGLPNFADDSSHIGYCPQKPDDTWDTGEC